MNVQAPEQRWTGSAVLDTLPIVYANQQTVGKIRAYLLVAAGVIVLAAYLLSLR